MAVSGTRLVLNSSGPRVVDRHLGFSKPKPKAFLTSSNRCHASSNKLDLK